VMRARGMVATLENRADFAAGACRCDSRPEVFLKGRQKKPARPGQEHAGSARIDCARRSRLTSSTNLSLTLICPLRAGEIVGTPGVAGNGQSALLEALAGIVVSRAAKILLDGVLPTPGKASEGIARSASAMARKIRHPRCGLAMPFERAKRDSRLP